MKYRRFDSLVAELIDRRTGVSKVGGWMVKQFYLQSSELKFWEISVRLPCLTFGRRLDYNINGSGYDSLLAELAKCWSELP